MRMISWNVNGLRAVLKKGFEDIVCQFDADVVALQETKLQAGQATLDLPQYREFWSYAEKKGYSGTAVFTKEEPLQVLHGLGFPHLDNEGRIVACEFPEYWFVCVYTPNAQNELARIIIAWNGMTRSATFARAWKRVCSRPVFRWSVPAPTVTWCCVRRRALAKGRTART